MEDTKEINGITFPFRPSDAQLAELEQLLEVQQNPSSPKHHAWLTPEEYGDRFGLSRVVFLRSPELCDVSDPHARSKWRLTMKNFLRCASLICAPGWAAFAQTTEPVRSPQIVWPKAAVTVVFAPDLGQATRRSGASRADALESWLHKAMVDGPPKDAPKPVQFAGPGGATGIRLGPEAMTATAVIVDEDGNRHSTCASLPDAVERLRSTSRRQRKEIVSEK